MSFWWRSKDFFKSKGFLSFTAFFGSVSTIFWGDIRFKKNLVPSLADDLVMRLEDDQKVREDYGLPVTFEKGFACGLRSRMRETEKGDEGIMNLNSPRKRITLEFERKFVTKKEFVKENGEVDVELMREYCVPGEEILQMIQHRTDPMTRIPDV